mmetsp:Transcript_31203/g.67452  ORF Transcript_31203/g.67452 Transcript_31203/m.67452 type:complete len:531 (+) Transcript_31203:93-1685(+)
MMRLRRHINITVVVTVILSSLYFERYLKYLEPIDSGSEQSQELTIAINSNSSIASDVTAIWHNRRNSAVCLRWNITARCPHPSLVGRLSGQALSVLEWDQKEISPMHSINSQLQDESIVYCGSYKDSWLLQGTYFLEVLIIHCNGFGSDLLKREKYRPISRMVGTEKLQFDFAEECLEDPERNRITAKMASIVVKNKVVGKGESSEGHWVSLGTEAVYPFYSRYQPQGCRGDDLPNNCKVAMDNTHKEMFSFVFRRDNHVNEILAPLKTNLSHMVPEDSMVKDPAYWDDIKRRPNRAVVQLAVIHLEKQVHGITRVVNEGGMGKFHPNSKLPSMKELTKGPKACLVGWSHSYHLVHAFYMNNLGHRFIWAPITTADKLSATFFENYHSERNCTKFIVAVGQWALGSQLTKWGGRPWTFEKWANELTRVSQIFTERDTMQLYFRSIHRLPIGDYVGQCGPGDWRSPTAIDAYNYIIEKVVHESNHSRVHFVDTRFITDPLWDTAYDWNHIAPRVSQAEAAYIALKVLGTDL